MAKALTNFLVTIEEDGKTAHKIVDERSFTIGRSLETTLSFSNPNISRVHVVVTYKHDGVYIEDQGSANGTFVNNEKIPPRKFIAVQPVDKIKVGNSEIYLRIMPIEKCYNSEEVKKANLNKEDRDEILNLVKSAQAESARLIKLAQEQHDQWIKKSEIKSEQLIREAEGKQIEIVEAAKFEATQVIQEAHKKSAQIIFDAEEKAESSVQTIYQRADAIKSEADRYYQQKIDESETKGNEIINKQRDAGQLLIQEARDKAQQLREQQMQEAEQIRIRAQADAQELMLVTGERLEKAKLELEDKVRQETKHEVDDIIRKAEQDADAQKKKILSDAQAEAENIFNDVKKQEQFGLDRIQELKKQIESLQAESLEKQNKKHLLEASYLVAQESLIKAEADLKLNLEIIEKTKLENQQIRKESEQILSEKQNAGEIIRQLQDQQQKITADIEHQKFVSQEQLQKIVAEIDHQKNQLQIMLSEYETKKIEQKNKLEDDFRKQTANEEEKLNQYKLQMLADAKQTQQKLVDELYSVKNKLSAEILKSIELQIVTKIKSEEWNSFHPILSQKVAEVIETQTAALVATEQIGDSIKLRNPKKSIYFKNIYWSGVGAVVAIVLVFATQYMKNKSTEGENSIELASKKFAEATKEDLERRKFSPQQVYELKDSYTDSVIYTVSYADVYLDNEVQQRWSKEATDYLLKKWRIDEDKSIQVLSAMNTLVSQLAEKRKSIHPDFVQQDIQKMRDFENETNARIIEMLGTNVKLQALKAFERKFFEDEIAKKISLQSKTN